MLTIAEQRPPSAVVDFFIEPAGTLVLGCLRVGPVIDAIRHPLLDQVCLIERTDGAVGVGVRGYGEPGAVVHPPFA